MNDEQEPTREHGGTTLKNKGRDAGWYHASNILTDKWARIVGPQAFLIFHTFKSLCKGQEERPFPRVRQQDWAEFMGMGHQVYQRNLKLLVDVGLVDVILPTGEDRIDRKPSRIILADPDEVPITREVLDRLSIKPMSNSCRFNDPLFEPDVWKQSMFRTKEMICAKTPRHITGNMSRDIADNLSCIKDSKVKDSDYPKDSLRVSDETQSLNETSHTSMKERTLQKIHTKSSTKKSPTEVLPLPPIEQMPEALQIWQNLPHVQRFRTRRVYDRCIKLIGALQQGRFPTRLSDLKKEDVDRYNITREVLSRKWTGHELAEIIDRRFRLMAENTAYWPGNKEQSFIKGLSFESFVFSPHNGRSCLLQLRQRRPEPMKERIAASGRKEKVFDEGEGFYYSTTPWSTAGD